MKTLDVDFSIPGQTIVNTIFGALLSVILGVSDVFKVESAEGIFYSVVCVMLLVCYGLSVQIAWWSFFAKNFSILGWCLLFVLLITLATFIFVQIFIAGSVLFPSTSKSIHFIVSLLFVLWLIGGFVTTIACTFVDRES